jgi:hypothetical protein
MKAYTHTHTMTEQFKRAREHKCNQYIISFNDYNQRLYEISRKYHLKKAFPDTVFVPSNGPVMFNGVLQQLLTVELQ